MTVLSTTAHRCDLVPLPGGHLVPATIAAASEQAAWRFIDFFTANIRNPNTRRAYLRACQQFFAWCDERGRTLTTIRPYDVASYIEARQQTHSAPDVKQQLAAVRMLFDWLVTGQVVPTNPAAAVRGPKHIVKTGATPVLEAGEWRRLLDAIPTEAVEFATLEWVDWLNHRRLLEPIGNVPPAEAEARYYAALDQMPLAA
jgi:transposase InsO family protein